MFPNLVLRDSQTVHILLKAWREQKEDQVGKHRYRQQISPLSLSHFYQALLTDDIFILRSVACGRVIGHRLQAGPLLPIDITWEFQYDSIYRADHFYMVIQQGPFILQPTNSLNRSLINP